MTNDKKHDTDSDQTIREKAGVARKPEVDLPKVERQLADQPGDAGSPHKGQGGTAGSGDAAELESVGQSQSDRASGKSS